MIKEIKIDTYDCSVYMLVGTDERAYKRWAKKMVSEGDMDEEDAEYILGFVKDPMTADGITHTVKYGYVVFVRYEEDANTLAHEVFHAVRRMLVDRGIKLSGDGEEYAYVIGQIHGEINKYL